MENTVPIEEVVQTLISIGKLKDAEKLLHQVLKMHKQSVPILNSLAMFYHMTLKDHEKGLEFYKEALKYSKDPYTKATLNYNLGCIYNDMSDYKNAIKHYDVSIKLGRVDEVKWNKCLALLNDGDWVDGMHYYHMRHRSERSDPTAVRFPELPIQYVNRLNELKGKRVLVLNEQGFGDEIMFSRAFPLAKEVSKKILIQCYPELHKLFQTSMSKIQFFVERSFGMEFVQQFDCWTSTGDLFAMMVSEEKPFPDVHPLRSSVSQYALDDNKKIGLCWSSNPRSRIAQNKSLKPEDMFFFKEIEDAKIYAFQTNGVPVPPWMIDLSDKLKTFDDTANFIKHMDIMISIDTAVAHLAGAIEKPTFLVINEYLDWRWKYVDENGFSKLYPTVKIVKMEELKKRLSSS